MRNEWLGIGKERGRRAKGMRVVYEGTCSRICMGVGVKVVYAARSVDAWVLLVQREGGSEGG